MVYAPAPSTLGCVAPSGGSSSLHVSSRPSWMIATPSEKANGTCSWRREELACNLVSSGSPICAKANSRKSTTGEELSVWRAFVLT